MISLFQPLIIPLGPFKIFVENLRKDSQLKVHLRCLDTRWEMEKICNQKSFHYFFWTPLGSRFIIWINFFLQVHFKLSAVWYCSHCLPPALLIPVVHRDWRISPRIFKKNRNNPSVIFRGLGKIHEKIWSKNSRDIVLLTFTNSGSGACC